jgi:tight adherence protein B
MRRKHRLRLAWLLAAAAAGLALTASVASGADGPRLVEGAGSGFPNRSYVLTLPTKLALDLSQVHVTENGLPVRGLSLVSEQAAAPSQFAVVFVIDASQSMSGEPITAAMAAVRSFEAHRSAGQSIGVIVFNRQLRVLLPLTTDGSRVTAALARTPTLGHGTRIYDALDLARGLLAGKVASGSIVLLSDGADLGSVAKPATVLHALAADHLRVFSVGLESSSFDRSALADVAAATGGSYVATAKPAGLIGIFDALGVTLSNQYVISYRSPIGPGRPVAVRIAIQGLPSVAVAGYSTPALKIVPAPPYHPSVFSKVIESSVTAFVLAILISGLFGWGVLTIVGRRSDTLPSRVGRFVSVSEVRGSGRRKGPTSEQQAARQFLTRSERPFERHRRWQQLEISLSVAGIDMTAGRLIMLTAIATVVSLIVLVLLIGIWGVLIALAVPFVVRSLIRAKVNRKRRAFAEQLPENLDVLASSLRAGHSLIAALTVVVEDTVEPSKSELRRVLVEEQLGVPLEDALKIVVERMDNQDIDQVALVARLQRDMGSNSAEVLDRIVETVRARMELRRLVRTLTTQGRFSRWVLTLIPVFLALALTLLNHGYLTPLFDHTLGRVMIAFACVMIISGSAIIGKIVDIKV